LFAAIGTSFGAGDGSTTFNLPDLSGRFALGETLSGTGAKFAQTFGALDHKHGALLSPHSHTLDVAAHAHGIDELQPHTHGWYFTLELNAATGPNQVFLKSQTGATEPATGGAFTTSTEAASVATTSSNASLLTTQGASPPYLALRWIILAKPAGDAPCGAIWYHANDSPPDGSQSASGAETSRTTDSWVFDCLQTTFGAGDGATTFNLPDLRARSAFGAAPSSPGAQTGESGGALNHTHATTINPVAHSVELPAHSHTAAEPAHSHDVFTPPPKNAIASGTVFGGVTGLEPTTGASPGATATSNIQPATSMTVASPGVESSSSGAANAPFLTLRPILFQTPSHRLPTGIVSAFAASKIPNGWLLADGSEISRSTYAPLFAVVGVAFGSGDGSTTFNLPDLRGRTPLGKADTGPGSQFAASGGSLDHVHELVVPDHSHAAIFPSHTHTFNFYYHLHTLGHTQVLADDVGAIYQSARGVDVQTTGGGITSATSQPSAAPSNATTPAGGGTVTTLPSNPPYLVVRYIIRL
jgi:microcystin-dependent protein